MSVLQAIIKSNVVSMSSHDNNTHFDFSNGAMLNIFNQHSTTPANTDLTGSTLTNVTENPNMIILTFDSFIELNVSLEEQAYTGPEALSYTDPTGRIIVWN